MALTTETIVHDAGLAAIEDEWRALWQQPAHPSPFLRYEWVAMCWRRVAANSPGSPRLVVVRQDGELVLAAPLMRHRRFGPLHEFHELTTTLPQYAEMLIKHDGPHEEWGRAFLREALRHPLALRVCLGRLPAPGEFGAAARGMKAKRTLYGDATLALLPDGYEAYLETRSKKLRSDHRRQALRLGETGAVTFRLADAQTLDGDLDWLLQQKRQWQPRSGELRTWLGLPGAERDLRDYCHAMLAADDLCFGILQIDGQRVGGALSFVARHAGLFYVLAYDPAFERYSPGRTALLLGMEAMALRGVTRFDFMGGGTEWKKRLGTDEMRVERVRLGRQ